MRYDGRPAYLPARGPAQLAAEQMRDVLKRHRDHREILQRFVTLLSPRDLSTLRTLTQFDGNQ